MARTDGNSSVDVAAFVVDDASPGDSLFLCRRRRRRGMWLPRLLTRDDTYFFACARKDAYVGVLVSRSSNASSICHQMDCLSIFNSIDLLESKNQIANDELSLN